MVTGIASISTSLSGLIWQEAGEKVVFSSPLLTSLGRTRWTLVLGICIGSAGQVALLVAPLLVIISGSLGVR
ncbi:hypothetical protein [Nitrobacter hamburgensis]|uniref:hypothetical protein n=1 Tax=Nitrobacter hamburgensis TaxID=912 RepID=UPI00059EB3C8|nr:hypothetical protein [Nitrobacter hamburgensis]